MINNESCFLLIGKNELERLGTLFHPTITPVGHHLLVTRLKYKRICLNRNKAFPTLNNKDFV